ncbi:MAG: exo-alpha-sialidase [Planctomycetes bacterium]|nr:exo-alpha-sialidase [Planctomycetota bacterium]
MRYSNDGGRTWTNRPPLELPPGSGSGANQSDPVIAADGNGYFYYNSLIFRSLRDGVCTYRSTTAGVDWEPPVYLTESGVDKNWYIVDNTGISTHHYGIWQFPGHFTRSTDEGQSYMPTMDIGASIFAHMNVGPGGELYAGWWRGDHVTVRRSDNAWDPSVQPVFESGRSVEFGWMPWQPPVNPAGGCSQLWIETNHMPGPEYGDVYVLSSAQRPDDVCDVMFSTSTDQGESFSTPIRVNDDPPGLDYNWMAAMDQSPGGRLDAFWYDTRDDPNHLLSRLYYSYSYDHGRTWAPNRALSDQFDTRIGWPQQRKIGDYFQCQSENGSAAVVYAATFNGEQDVYYLRTHPIELRASDLIGGQPATIEITGAKPNEPVWLAASLAGEGFTNVPKLSVRIGILKPQQVDDRLVTDANGRAEWNVFVPRSASGRTVWLQAVQFENASNVAASAIQ